MRKDAGTYGDAQRLEQLGWLFFLKIFDDREKEMELVRDNWTQRFAQYLLRMQRLQPIYHLVRNARREVVPGTASCTG
jgi:hypothetical protein